MLAQESRWISCIHENRIESAVTRAGLLESQRRAVTGWSAVNILDKKGLVGRRRRSEANFRLSQRVTGYLLVLGFVPVCVGNIISGPCRRLFARRRPIQ